MGLLDSLFGRSKETIAGRKLVALLSGCYQGFCNACYLNLTSSDQDVQEALQRELKTADISPWAFACEGQIVILCAAQKIIYQMPWGQKVGRGLLLVVAWRIVLANELGGFGADMDRKIVDLIRSTDSIETLEAALLIELARPGGKEALDLIKSRFQDYNAILAEGWLPASTRLGTRAVQAMMKGTGEVSPTLVQFLWLAYTSTHTYFTEIISSVKGEL